MDNIDEHGIHSFGESQAAVNALKIKALEMMLHKNRLALYHDYLDALSYLYHNSGFKEITSHLNPTALDEIYDVLDNDDRLPEPGKRRNIY